MGMNVVVHGKNSTGGLPQKIKSVEENLRVVLPSNSFGTLSVGEIKTPITAVATTTLSFVNGLNGITIEFYPKIFPAAGSPDAFECYVAFNNTPFNDVSVAGLRHCIKLGSSKTFSFTDYTLPTAVYITTDTFEATLGDTKVVWTAVEA